MMRNCRDAYDGGGSSRKLCGHPCWENNPLTAASRRDGTSKNSCRCSARCRTDHKRSVAVHRYMTCITEEFLSLKTLSFLHSHSDQITAIAPTRISSLNLESTPFNQLPKIFATLRGGYKVEPIWIADHIDLANSHWKNRCLIVSS